jgi:hypothetical protein
MALFRSIAVTTAFAVMAAMHQASAAAPQRIECPKEVGAATIRLVARPDGWKPYQSMPLKLNSAAPTGGPPELHADLAQFTTKRSKTVRVDTYDLSPPHPGGIWMKCGYGAANEITLHKRLNDHIAQCTFTQNNADPSNIEIVCR